jgi:hypothetical protein
VNLLVSLWQTEVWVCQELALEKFALNFLSHQIELQAMELIDPALLCMAKRGGSY